MSDWIWLVGVTVLLVGRVVNLLVAQSHSVGLSEAITPTTLLWLASGLLVTFLGVGLRDE
jgi:hypothetical protein